MKARRGRVIALVAPRPERPPSQAEQARIAAREHAEMLVTQIDRAEPSDTLELTVAQIVVLLRRAEELDR